VFVCRWHQLVNRRGLIPATRDDDTDNEDSTSDEDEGKGGGGVTAAAVTIGACRDWIATTAAPPPPPRVQAVVDVQAAAEEQLARDLRRLELRIYQERRHRRQRQLGIERPLTN
jgi:hypothetical protein